METTQGLQGLKIALLIDFDNVILGVEDPGFDVELVVNALRSRGIVVMGRAYGDWYRHNRHRRKLMEQGIELVETPVFGPLIKNSADIRIVLDAFEIAMSQAHIDAFCLVSGDSDFLPLIKKLQYLGKIVIVIAGNKFTSDLVRRNCNEFVSYENLLAESVGATEDVSTLEGAYQLLDRTINTLHERGMDVRSSTVKQMMLQLNPAFSERTFGCTQFKQFLDKAQRAGIIKLGNRDGVSGEFSVLLPSDLEPIGHDAAVPTNGAAQETSYKGVLRPERRPDRPERDRRTYAERRREANLLAAAEAAPLATPAPSGTAEDVTPPEEALETPIRGVDAATGEGAQARTGNIPVGPIPASTFLSRNNLRRGRLRFSGKDKRANQAASSDEVTTGPQTNGDMPAETVTSLEATSQALPGEAMTPDAASAELAASELTDVAEVAATAQVEATVAEPQDVTLTPVAEAPISPADNELPDMLADEEAVAKSLPKRRPTRNQRRKKADKAKSDADTATADNAATDSVAQESAVVETVPVVGDVAPETADEIRATASTPGEPQPSAETAGAESDVPTVNEPEAVIEEAAKKPVRRRRSPARKK